MQKANNQVAVDRIFKDLDSNKDNSVDFQEFGKMIFCDVPWILHMQKVEIQATPRGQGWKLFSCEKEKGPFWLIWMNIYYYLQDRNEVTKNCKAQWNKLCSSCKTLDLWTLCLLDHEE